MNITDVATQLTASQIQDVIIGKAAGLMISIGILGLGLFLSKGGLEEIKGYIGLVMDILGGLGTIYFLLGLIDIISIMMQTK